jgi:hypothetical protein
VLSLALVTEFGEVFDSVHLYVGPVVLLLAAVPLWTMSDRRFLFQVLGLASAMLAIKTQMRFAARGPMIADSEDLMRGTLDKLDPNYAACYIGFGAVCALYLLIESLGGRQQRRIALFWLVPIALSLLAMGRLASRGITIALVLALGTLVMTAPLKLPARVGALALVLAVGLGVALSGGFDLLWSRFLKDDVATGNNRADINAVALRLFADRPLPEQLLGGGGSSSTRAMGWHTHNAFTEQLLDHGTVGGACFVGLFACLCKASVGSKGLVRASGLALLVFTAVASMSVSPFMYAWGWVALACILPCSANEGSPNLLARQRARA